MILLRWEFVLLNFIYLFFILQKVRLCGCVGGSGGCVPRRGHCRKVKVTAYRSRSLSSINEWCSTGMFHCRAIFQRQVRKDKKTKNEALFSYINDVSVDLNVACSRLRDSRVRWTEKARTWKKNKKKTHTHTRKKREKERTKKKRELGRGRADCFQHLPRQLFAGACHFRVLPTNRLI